MAGKSIGFICPGFLSVSVFYFMMCVACVAIIFYNSISDISCFVTRKHLLNTCIYLCHNVLCYQGCPIVLSAPYLLRTLFVPASLFLARHGAKRAGRKYGQRTLAWVLLAGGNAFRLPMHICPYVWAQAGNPPLPGIFFHRVPAGYFPL